MASYSGGGGGGGGSGNNGDQLLEVGTDLLRNFIYQRVQQHDTGNTVLAREHLGVREVSDPNHRRLGQELQRIGDQLDGNVELQRLINNTTLVPSRETFVRVACEIFKDGIFNWGRVVTLFYFACKLVMKALTTNVPDIIRTIIWWTRDYLREHVINWIREQGGWEGVRSYFGTPTWQTVGVFLAGVITAVIVMRKM